ncbi:MAG: sigma 54-interacting transcriptional regulator [Thermodesulfobacteriota bacterium]
MMADTELKKMEETPSLRDEDYRTLLENIPVLIVRYDTDLRQIYVNPAWEKATGLSSSDVVNKRVDEILEFPFIAEHLEKLRQILQKGTPQKIEFSWVNGRGKTIFLEFVIVPEYDRHRKIISLLAVGIDQTERREAEEQIRNSERNLRTTIETIPAYVFSAPPDGPIDFVSQSLCDLMGLSPEMVLGWDWTTLLHPEDRDRVVERWREALTTGEPVENEYRARQANGEYRWFLHRSAALRDDEGHIVRWYGVAIDIENQKRAEEQLRNSERNLRTTIDTIPAYVFSALPDGSFDFISQSLLDLTGFSPEAVFGWDWTIAVHPEDRDRAVERWRESLATGKPRENEHRLRQANGEYRWFLARNAALRDENGQIVRWYGVLVDIENQKRTEARLLQALDEIKKLRDQLSKENIVLREEVDRTSMFEEIVGASPALKAVLARINKVAPTDSIVFITGETGTGKELVARAIHKRSPRSAHAFVGVNCAAIPAPLIASELFGHEKGAFTGAHQRRLGRFELAEGGTIFLDEIGELPMETQIALLRVLQDQQFERLGGNQPIRANARVITATNRDLEAAIAAGSFRRDLFYRLNVFPIEIPPLRERKEDIPILVEYFIHRYANKLGKKIRSASRKTLELLQSYSWPGNIRELQNVIERSIIVCDTEIFSVDENWFLGDSCQPQPLGRPLSDMLVSQTKEMIEAALAESGGRVSGPSGAAAKLGMPASTLESKIKSLKIDKYLFKKST